MQFTDRPSVGTGSLAINAPRLESKTCPVKISVEQPFSVVNPSNGYSTATCFHILPTHSALIIVKPYVILTGINAETKSMPVSYHGNIHRCGRVQILENDDKISKFHSREN